IARAAHPAPASFANWNGPPSLIANPHCSLIRPAVGRKLTPKLRRAAAESASTCNSKPADTQNQRLDEPLRKLAKTTTPFLRVRCRNDFDCGMCRPEKVTGSKKIPNVTSSTLSANPPANAATVFTFVHHPKVAFLCRCHPGYHSGT